MQKTCGYKEPGSEQTCGADATWVADVGWVRDEKQADPSYTGTSWNVALCERHYQQLVKSDRISGTARRA